MSAMFIRGARQPACPMSLLEYTVATVGTELGLNTVLHNTVGTHCYNNGNRSLLSHRNILRSLYHNIGL
jgi:hypothetical protein